MTGWIQAANYTTRELGTLTLAKAKEIFNTHPWDQEEEAFRAIEGQGGEGCDPGMGIVNPNGLILHLCPLPEERLLVHYHFPARTGIAKSLGHPETRTLPNVPIGVGDWLIGYFYRDDHDDLVQRIDRLAEGWSPF